MKQKGIAAGWLYLIGLAALVGALTWLHHTIDARGYARGEAKVQAAWDKEKLDAGKAAVALRKKQDTAMREEVTARQAAETLAADYQALWQEARDDARKQKRPLANVQCPAAGSRSGTSMAIPEVDDSAGVPRLLLTWEFVSLFDSAWTRADGKPLFADPAGILARAGRPDPASSSPYGLGDILERHKVNAGRDDTCRRQLTGLIGVINRLSTNWEAAQKGSGR
jgi:hypothetical protein